MEKQKFNPNLPTVLYVLRDESGCGFYRCLQPALALRQYNLLNSITDVRTTTPEHILQADIVVFQEIGSSVSLEAFNFAKANKKKIVVEVDDYLNVVSPHNPGYECWNPGTLYLHRAIEQMRKADAMTVSTPQLAREYFPYNKNIYVIPNFLNEEKWDAPQVKKQDGCLRIGWAGGNAHIDDLRMVSPVLQKIIKEYQSKVKFESMGMLKKELQGAFSGLEEFMDTCPKCGYQGESVTWAGENLDNHPLVLASHGWDIAIAPIINTAFNCAKSDLKLKEYSAIGYPIVASRVPPYIEAVKDGCNVLLADGFEEWYESIKELLENSEKRDKMVKNNKEWIKKYWVSANASKFAEIYREIIGLP